MDRATKWLFAIGIALIPILVCENAWAWGPATHLYYGLAVLDQLGQLSDAMRMLLAAEPMAFLYGNVSADIVLAKKLGKDATHCHNWENGLKLIDNAPTERTRAFAIGYTSHLAADTISHNCYVPSKTIESYDSSVLKHLYWELMFDKAVTMKGTLNLFKEIAKGDFSDCDEHLERQIPTRIFDFSTNKRIFNHLLMLQSLEQWQFLWSNIARNSKRTLSESEVEAFKGKAMEAVMSFLKDGRDSPFVRVDPTGSSQLRLAHQLKRFYKSSKRERRKMEPERVANAVRDFSDTPFHNIDGDDHGLK